jgi:hypothetical protein
LFIGSAARVEGLGCEKEHGTGSEALRRNPRREFRKEEIF